jgi:hypothetical protein
MADLIDIGFRFQGAEQGAKDLEKLKQETEKLNNEQKKAETSVKSYSAQIKALRLELIALGNRTKENATEYDNLSKRIRELDDAQEDLLIGTGQLDDQLSALPGPVGKLSSLFKTYDIALKNVKGAKVALIKQFPILKNAIAATGFGALVVLLGLVVASVGKALGSFKPLQAALERFGIAIGLVEKLLEPLVNLFGTFFANAIDQTARAIASLTGNLDEYNKAVEQATSKEKLKKQLEQEAALWELNKDKFSQFEQDKGNAAQANLKRIQEINDLEGLSAEERDARKIASEQLYQRDLLRAKEDENKRKVEFQKKEAERIKKSKELTQEQIDKIKELNQITLNALNDQITLLAARGIEQFEGVRQYDELNRRLQFFGSVLENAKTQLEKFETQINNFTIKKDEGLPLLNKALDEANKNFKDAFKSADLLAFSTAIKKTTDEFATLDELLDPKVIRNNAKTSFEIFENSLSEIFNELLEKKDLFVKDIEGPFRAVVRNYSVLLQVFKETGFKEYDALITAVEKRDDAFRKGSRTQEVKAGDELKEIRDKFLAQYIKRQVEAAEATTKTQKEQKQFALEFIALGKKTDENAKEWDRLNARVGEYIQVIGNAGKSTFDNLTENILSIKAFKNGVQDVNEEFKKTETAIQKAFKQGTLNAFIQQDLEGTTSELEKINENLIKTKRTLDDAFYVGKETPETIMDQINALPPNLNPILDGLIKIQKQNGLLGLSFGEMVDKSKVITTIPIDDLRLQAEEAVKAIQALVATMGSGFTISAETAQLLLDKLLQKRTEAQVILERLDTEYLGSQYDQQMAALENQRLIDIQLLKDKKATQEQLTKLEEIYAEKRKDIQGRTNLFVLNSTGEIMGNVAELFGEHTTAFKTLKYFEAIVAAISSSVQAYESALTYGGPAGPVLAPILAASTFYAQQRQAMKILQTPEPEFKPTAAPGPGGLFGRDGGLVFGRTHEQGGVQAELEGGEFILNRRSMMIPGVADLALRLNNLDQNMMTTTSQPQVIKTYVLSGEITTAQKADKRIRDLSRL